MKKQKKPAPPAVKKRRVKLFIFYQPGPDAVLDEKIEAAVGVGAVSTGHYVEPPNERDMRFEFEKFDDALLAARRVGVLSNKLKRVIKYNIL